MENYFEIEGLTYSYSNCYITEGVEGELIYRYEALHRGLGLKKAFYSVAYLLNGPNGRI